MSSRPDELYDAIYQQTEKQHEQVLRLVKEMTAHPEAFSEQEKEKINRMDIALQTATDILENLMNKHAGIRETILLKISIVIPSSVIKRNFFKSHSSEFCFGFRRTISE